MNRGVLAQRNASGSFNWLLHRVDLNFAPSMHRYIGKHSFPDFQILSHNYSFHLPPPCMSYLPSKHGEVRTTNCMLSSGMCMKHDECSNNFGSYVLGCYYDPFPPHLLAGDFFHFDAGDISVAGCIKTCGEAGFMLAGLR